MINIILKIFINNIYKPTGLIIGIAALSVGIVFYIEPNLIAIVTTLLLRILIYIILYMLVSLSWHINRNYFPKNVKNKIGILVSIVTENEKQSVRIKNDFIREMKRLLFQNNLNHLINIISIQDYKAENINILLDDYNSKKQEVLSKTIITDDHMKSKEFKSFENFSKKIHCHLFIWGNIKERLDGENKYIINISSMVMHKPLNVQISNNISKDFQKIMPPEISFYEKMEAKGFKLASKSIFIGSRYMIGIAALLSGDPFTSFSVHNGLLSDLSKEEATPECIYIINSLKDVLVSELVQQSKYYFDIKMDYRKAKEYLERAKIINANSYDVLIYCSYYAFNIDKEHSIALEYCNRASLVAKNDFTWLYNRAFIYMFIEDFNSAYNDYVKIKDTYYPDEAITIAQCIQFNENYYLNNSQFKQSLFIIGYFYYFKLSNYPMAFEKFELFINEVKGEMKYDFLYNKSVSFYNELQKRMKVNNSLS
jgi:hypothetical protein